MAFEPRDHTIADDVPAQQDPRRNPDDGIYSGMTKRIANSEGQHVDIGNLPRSERNRGSHKTK
jgi:hypothetical protein